jgi:hypothetical protein
VGRLELGKDSEAEVGGVLGFDDLGSFEPDRLAEVVEQSGAGAEDEWGDVEVDAVDEAGLEGLLDDRGAAHMCTFLSPAAARACAIADSIPSVAKVKVVSPLTTGSWGRWVRTKTGMR